MINKSLTIKISFLSYVMQYIIAILYTSKLDVTIVTKKYI